MGLISDYLNRRRAGKQAEQDVIEGRKAPTVGKYANDPEAFKDLLRRAHPEKFGATDYVFEWEKNQEPKVDINLFCVNEKPFSTKEAAEIMQKKLPVLSDTIRYGLSDGNIAILFKHDEGYVEVRTPDENTKACFSSIKSFQQHYNDKSEQNTIEDFIGIIDPKPNMYYPLKNGELFIDQRSEEYPINNSIAVVFPDKKRVACSFPTLKDFCKYYQNGGNVFEREKQQRPESNFSSVNPLVQDLQPNTTNTISQMMREGLPKIEPGKSDTYRDLDGNMVILRENGNVDVFDPTNNAIAGFPQIGFFEKYYNDDSRQMIRNMTFAGKTEPEPNDPYQLEDKNILIYNPSREAKIKVYLPQKEEEVCALFTDFHCFFRYYKLVVR